MTDKVGKLSAEGYTFGGKTNRNESRTLPTMTLEILYKRVLNRPEGNSRSIIINNTIRRNDTDVSDCEEMENEEPGK